MNPCIYVIENKINNKKYIGQSTNIKRRFARHKYDSKTKDTKLYRAIRKYGIDNFKFYVVEECDKQALDIREQYWVSYYNTYKNGYNSSEGGQASGEGVTSSRIDELTALRILYLKKFSHLTSSKISNILNVTIPTVNGVGKLSWVYLNKMVDTFDDEYIKNLCKQFPIDAFNILVFDKQLKLLGEYTSTKHILQSNILSNVKIQTDISRAISKRLCIDNKILIYKKDFELNKVVEIANKSQNRVNWIDVYTEDGNLIDRVKSRKEMKQKFNLTNSQISNGIYIDNQVVTKGFILITEAEFNKGIDINYKLKKLHNFRR